MIMIISPLVSDRMVWPTRGFFAAGGFFHHSSHTRRFFSIYVQVTSTHDPACPWRCSTEVPSFTLLLGRLIGTVTFPGICFLILVFVLVCAPVVTVTPGHQVQVVNYPQLSSLSLIIFNVLQCFLILLIFCLLQNVYRIQFKLKSWPKMTNGTSLKWKDNICRGAAPLTCCLFDYSTHLAQT